MFTLEQRLKQAYDIILEIHRDVDAGKLDCREYHIEVIEGIESRVTAMKYAVISDVNKHAQDLSNLSPWELRAKGY